MDDKHNIRAIYTRTFNISTVSEVLPGSLEIKSTTNHC